MALKNSEFLLVMTYFVFISLDGEVFAFAVFLLVFAENRGYRIGLTLDLNIYHPLACFPSDSQTVRDGAGPEARPRTDRPEVGRKAAGVAHVVFRTSDPPSANG